MDPMQRALWFVESHYRDPITLDDIARACKVSNYHLTRAFAATTGRSLMRYVRARRLSEAAHQLAEGAGDILRVALDAGYGSHEAFTRAFRDQFDLTPEQVRDQGHLNNIPILEAVAMTMIDVPNLASPRIAKSEPFLLAGLVERYNCEDPAGIPGQWQKFSAYLGNLPGKKSNAAYGACYHFDQEGFFDYMSGVEVNTSAGLPAGLKSLPIPALTYAIFHDKGHIAGIRSTMKAIWSTWFLSSGYKAAEGPTLERYGPEFNPMTGLGGYEIWVPIVPKEV